MIKIAVILGSTRDGRLGARVAQWAFRRLALQEGVEAELLDLKEYPLPFYTDEATPSAFKGSYPNEVARRWHDKIAEMDGYIIVTPEYNFGYPAVLKNALDYLYQPWNDKPVSFISYSTGPIGGARALAQLRQVVVNLRLVAIQEATSIGRAQEVFSEQGEVLSGPFDSLLGKQLVQTVSWAATMRERRQK